MFHFCISKIAVNFIVVLSIKKGQISLHKCTAGLGLCFAAEFPSVYVGEHDVARWSSGDWCVCPGTPTDDTELTGKIKTGIALCVITMLLLFNHIVIDLHVALSDNLSIAQLQPFWGSFNVKKGY